MGNTLSDNAVTQIAELFQRVDTIERRRGITTPRQGLGQRVWKGKTVAAHASGDTGSIDLYSGDKGSETDTLRNVVAFNTFGDLDSGDWVFIQFIDGGWEIIGGGAGCTSQNAFIDIVVIGSPTGGTFDMDLTINATEETLTFNWDDTNTEVDTELDTHTQITSGDVIVTKGPFPDATIRIEFAVNLANTPIALPTLDWASLTGGTGVAVIAATAQLGVA